MTMHSLEMLNGLGAKRLQALYNVGIMTQEQLVLYFPAKYADYTNVKAISDCVPGEDAVLRVRVSGKVSQARVRGRAITRAVLCDESGTIPATWFSQPWMFKQLNGREEFTVYGRIDRFNGKLCLNAPRIVTDLSLTPVYSPIDAIPPKVLRSLIRDALENCALNETLPESLISQYGLMPRNEAVRQMHFPADRQTLERALYRFHFEELLFFMMNAVSIKQNGERGVCVSVSDQSRKEYLDALSFPLTGAQKRVLGEIERDLASERPMARLVQGDVGSGKTAVAFGTIYECVKDGWQCAMMAPTEILAQQHFDSARTILGKIGVNCALLTGNLSAKQRRQVLEGLESGEIQAVFGTHALVSPNVKYKNLGFAVTDEQHRFGVRQRTRLGEKGSNPNVLVMSATPIPRTIALILYGDLDISVIDELPPGRIPVKTRLVPESKREDLYGFIVAEAKKGKQAYFVCPLVEDSEAVEAESAQHLFDEMKHSSLGQLRIGLVYGRQSNDEKQETLEKFYRGELDILVSTTVIEVGVNVPNATVMVVENAERFGLSQLHQLRGRVGRGMDEAWCFLMANATEKLRVMTQTNDGFVIAQKDLQLRGPGDLFGTRQTGAIAGLDIRAAEDSRMLSELNTLAKKIARSEDEDSLRIKAEAALWLKDKNDVIFAAN